MSMELQFLGATGEVTGSMYLLRMPQHTVLLECGLVQGGRKTERRNADPFEFDVADIDAVIISHAHIDHSGRIPLLVKRGYKGPIIAQNATRDLCRIMLPDSGYLNEKQAEWENKHRKGDESPAEALYTRADAVESLQYIEGAPYDSSIEVVPGLNLRLHDAGHILGSAIVELQWHEQGDTRTLVFSGDLGYADAPVMESPAVLRHADTVLLESTYGDRLHRNVEDTLDELTGVFESARAGHGNILIPAFTVGRTQDLLFMMSQNRQRWHLDDWHIYLDSPMGIDATATYARYHHLYGADLFIPGTELPNLPNFHATRSTEESMSINEIRSGAVIIAGSGMCTGGRIHHHLKNNVSRPECHLVIVGFQAHGTLGRRLVDGAESIRLWGEDRPVRLQVHTVGGLSAHADQNGLLEWYGNFDGQPPVYLVHGEPDAQRALKARLAADKNAQVTIAEKGQTITI
ncbi:MAG: MBL fold metallo-hydrolase [Woeseia sp.]|nr:MBL fold metallo-hydrolase [Woeseia sp.]